jgi:hypothetical protein
MSDTEKEEQTQAEDTELDTTSASLADLEKRLTEIQDHEETLEQEPEDEESEQPEAPKKEDQTEAVKETPKTQEAKAPEASKETETLKKQVRDKELMLQRQAYQIGQLRKEREALEARVKQKQEGLSEKFSESPEQALDDKFEIRETQKEISDVDQRIERTKAQAIVEAFVEPKEGLGEEIVECLRSDGLDAEYINSFVNDPYGVATSSEIVQLSKRAEERMIAKNLYGMLQTAISKIKELQKKPEALLDKVNQSLKGGPVINGRTGRTANDGRANDTGQLSSMSLDSLYASLKEAQR